MHANIRTLLNNLLPNWVYDRLIGDWNEDGLKKYLHNTGWMLAARIVTFITSVITMAAVARYLGPENLGKLSYAQSFVSIISVFASLGIDQIIYRDLVRYPERQKEILGTAIISKLFFGTCAFFISVLLSAAIGNESVLTLIIGITAFTFIVGPLGTIGIYFQAQVKARYISEATIFVALVIPALKFITIFLGGGIIFFASLLVVESLMISLWSVYIYVSKFRQNPLLWTFSSRTFRRLMHDAWPFLFAGLFSYLYARIDQVMLLHYLDSTAVGIYDTAVKVSNVFGFFPAIIISALFPAIVQAKKHDHFQYIKRYYAMTILVLCITLVITIPIFLAAKPIILILFGNAFVDSIPLLKIYIWSGAIATLGILTQQYLVTENLGWVHLLMTIIGAIVNIGLNLVLIPSHGVTGAAIATLFSYSIIPLGLLFLGRFRRDIRILFLRKPKTLH